MTYSLIQLAPGSYDLLLAGSTVASVVRSGVRSTDTVWTAELLEELPPDRRPAPFVEIEHNFGSLVELCEWLGNPQVQNHRRNGSMTQGPLA
ncbi:hypothetical protein ACD578_27030 (plasmid) [Microvirga sp. RSM25]|uniref:hypothetical protein n=1 Tax=Microvirga sp. RSM25 TaxID=3273802 RepID=UPI0038502F49